MLPSGETGLLCRLGEGKWREGDLVRDRRKSGNDLRVHSILSGMSLYLDVENTEVCASPEPYRRTFVYRDDSGHNPDSCLALHSPCLCRALDHDLANFLHGYYRYRSLCGVTHDPYPALSLAPSRDTHHASPKPCHPCDPLPFYLAPIPPLLLNARPGSSSYGGHHSENHR